MLLALNPDNKNKFFVSQTFIAFFSKSFLKNLPIASFIASRIRKFKIESSNTNNVVILVFIILEQQ